MATATSTCAYYNPVRADGSPVGVPGVDTFQFASSTCVTVSDIATSSSASVVWPTGALLVRDSGSVVFGLALLIFITGIAVLGLLFPVGTSKRH